MPTAILPSLSCLKDAEKAVTTEVGFKGSGWAQLYTTVWWSLLPICICKSLRILFVCLFEPGQVCWTRAKAEIKTSNPISYYTYCCYNSLLWSTFFPLEWRVEFAQSSRCCQFRGPRLHENFSKQKCYNHWCYIESWHVTRAGYRWPAHRHTVVCWFTVTLMMNTFSVKQKLFLFCERSVI